MRHERIIQVGGSLYARNRTQEERNDGYNQ